MTKLQLTKAAIDFSFANHQADAVTLAEGSIAAFKATGNPAEDFQAWNQSVSSYTQQAINLARQKLPSEAVAASPQPSGNASVIAQQPAPAE